MRHFAILKLPWLQTSGPNHEALTRLVHRADGFQKHTHTFGIRFYHLLLCHFWYYYLPGIWYTALRIRMNYCKLHRKYVRMRLRGLWFGPHAHRATLWMDSATQCMSIRDSCLRPKRQPGKVKNSTISPHSSISLREDCGIPLADQIVYTYIRWAEVSKIYAT